MNLPTADYRALRRWADREQTTVSELIRRALTLTSYLAAVQDQGARIIIKSEGKKDKELLPLRRAAGFVAPS